MKKKAIIIGSVILCLSLGGIISIHAADDLNIEKPKPLCYDDPELSPIYGTCKPRVGGGNVCVWPAEEGREDCTGDSYDI